MKVGAICLPGTLEAMDALAGFVRDMARRAGLSVKTERRLLMAADEIVSNIILHGFKNSDGAKQQIEVEAGIDDDFLSLTVTDRGASFDPRTLPAPATLDAPIEKRTPGGLGIYLTLKQLDDFSYSRRGGKNISVLKTRCRPDAA